MFARWVKKLRTAVGIKPTVQPTSRERPLGRPPIVMASATTTSSTAAVIKKSAITFNKTSGGVPCLLHLYDSLLTPDAVTAAHPSKCSTSGVVVSGKPMFTPSSNLPTVEINHLSTNNPSHSARL